MIPGYRQSLVLNAIGLDFVGFRLQFTIRFRRNAAVNHSTIR